MKKGKAIVVFSGGQDSTTCLYWALNRYEEVEAINKLIADNLETTKKTKLPFF